MTDGNKRFGKDNFCKVIVFSEGEGFDPRNSFRYRKFILCNSSGIEHERLHIFCIKHIVDHGKVIVFGYYQSFKG